MGLAREADRVLTQTASRFGDDQPRIAKAMLMATEAHKGQRRKEGENYITHPIAATELLLGMEHESVDADTVIATILHDTVEDTDITLDDIKGTFGEDVAFLVSAVTDPKQGSTREERDRAHLERISEAAESDERVWLVRIADQLHNAHTLHVHSEERQAELAAMNLDFYVPAARRLGLDKEADRLEMLSQPHLKSMARA